MLEAMGSDRYAALVGAFAAALRAGDQGAGESARPIFDYAGDLLRKRYKQLRKDASGLEPSSDTSAYHEVRVAAKRLRYALDSFKEVFPRRVQRAIRATRDVQDLLGEHQDCAVSIGRLKSTIEEKGASFPPATVFRAGELTEQRRQRMVDLREAWPESYAELRASWRRFAKGLECCRGDERGCAGWRWNRRRDEASATPGPEASLAAAAVFWQAVSRSRELGQRPQYTRRQRPDQLGRFSQRQLFHFEAHCSAFTHREVHRCRPRCQAARRRNGPSKARDPRGQSTHGPRRAGAPRSQPWARPSSARRR